MVSALHVLNPRDVQRICSGQSVVDLATAVKELVENSLDAGATNIEVKLKEFGRDAFEVSDNGVGVAPENYVALASKHCTSKISSFEDIETVKSFGFRGEALSSICELAASFIVCTRTENEEVGALLAYDVTGKLVKETKKARPVGTTVTVEQLFKPLAVRYKDFHRNIKKHYTKLLKVLQAYAVSCANVKICVFNSTSKNATRNIVLATRAHQTMGENIANVFGTKFYRSLVHVDFELKLAKAENTVLHDAKNNDNENESTIEDKISGKERKVVGYVSKVGAGVGRSDNDRQFFFINGRPFDLPKMAKALNEVWRQFEMKQKPACAIDFHLPFNDYDVNVTPDKRETFIKHETEIIEAFKTGLNELYEPSRGRFIVQPLVTVFAQGTKRSSKEMAEANVSEQTSLPAIECREKNSTPLDTVSLEKPSQDDSTKISIGETLEEDTKSKTTKKHGKAEGYRHRLMVETSPRSPLSSPEQDSSRTGKRQKSTTLHLKSSTVKDNAWSFNDMINQRKQYFNEEINYERKQKSKRFRVPKACSIAAMDKVGGEDNEVASVSFQGMLKKDDFKRMEIIGQFNLGFIIGKLDNDLFIIDQHASDEKFNYETLQQNTVMHQQPLVRPLQLELTAGEEMVILDHMPVFTKNGFTFLIDTDAPATKKLKLLSLPFSKQTQFGVEDIRELASLLIETPLNPSTICLPKVMTMLASRACRTSIMIGTALHKEEMQKIVRNLSGLNQPWNCPHGRPTLRHLVDLTDLENVNYNST